MMQARLAQWLLKRTTTRERAEAELGDLLELRPARGGLWFWTSVLRLAIRQGWRGVAAFLAAFYGAAWGQQALMMRTNGYNSPHPFPWIFPDRVWWLKLLVPTLWMVGTAAWAIFLVAGIRFGPGDKLMRASGVLGASIWLVAYFWWQPIVVTLACTAPCMLGAYAIISKAWRPTVLSLGILTGAYLCFFYCETLLAFLYQKSITGPLIGTAELHAHPSIIWVWFILHVTTFMAFVRTCCFVHARAERHDRKRMLPSR